MSRRKNQPRLPAPAANTQAVVKVRSFRTHFLENSVGYIGIGVGFAALIVSLWTAKVAQRAEDRASGEMKAKIKSYRLTPDWEDINPSYITSFHHLPTVIKFENLDQLHRLDPMLPFVNIGEYPIDTIRIETRFIMGLIDIAGKLKANEVHHTPWILEQVKREDYPLSKSIVKGDNARVSVIRGVVSQLMQAQDPKLTDCIHYAMFEIKCYGRVVGATSFDEADSPGDFKLAFIWNPKGFPADECKKLVDSMQPHVLIQSGKLK